MRHGWPLLLGVLAAGSFYAFGLQREFSPEALIAHAHALRGLIHAYPLTAGAVYATATAVYLMLSLPAEGLLTIAGGAYFGTVFGSVLSIAGTIGAAVLLYLAFRYMLPPRPEATQGTRLIDRVRRRLGEDAISYLMFLRLFPILPFALVSILPVLVGMRFRPYVLASAIGVVPPAVIFTSLGSGVAKSLASNPHLALDSLVTARVLLPLAALGILSLVPVLWRHRGRFF